LLREKLYILFHLRKNKSRRKMTFSCRTAQSVGMGRTLRTQSPQTPQNLKCKMDFGSQKKRKGSRREEKQKSKRRTHTKHFRPFRLRVPWACRWVGDAVVFAGAGVSVRWRWRWTTPIQWVQ
jgi:hypothetical protein